MQNLGFHVQWTEQKRKEFQFAHRHHWSLGRQWCFHVNPLCSWKTCIPSCGNYTNSSNLKTTKMLAHHSLPPELAYLALLSLRLCQVFSVNSQPDSTHTLAVTKPMVFSKLSPLSDDHVLNGFAGTCLKTWIVLLEASFWRNLNPLNGEPAHPKEKVTHSAVLNCCALIFIVRLTCLQCLRKKMNRRHPMSKDQLQTRIIRSIKNLKPRHVQKFSSRVTCFFAMNWSSEVFYHMDREWKQCWRKDIECQAVSVQLIYYRYVHWYVRIFDITLCSDTYKERQWRKGSLQFSGIHAIFML